MFFSRDSRQNVSEILDDFRYRNHTNGLEKKSCPLKPGDQVRSTLDPSIQTRVKSVSPDGARVQLRGQAGTYASKFLEKVEEP